MTDNVTAARSSEWAQHFSNDSCFMYLSIFLFVENKFFFFFFCVFLVDIYGTDQPLATSQLRDIRLDESGFGFGECIRDARVYIFTR